MQEPDQACGYHIDSFVCLQLTSLPVVSPHLGDSALHEVFTVAMILVDDWALHSTNCRLPAYSRALCWVQRQLILLPKHLWARVLSNLDLSNLLKARYISKGFVDISQLRQLDIENIITSQENICSLSLFLSRHCSDSASPEVRLRSACVRGCCSGGAFPIVMAACSCANLRRLDLSNHDMLERAEAQACLRLLPGSLTDLGILAPPDLVDDPAWARLASLTQLEFRCFDTGDVTSRKGLGLAALGSLQHLHIDYEDGSTSQGILDGASFTHSTITCLSFNADPFQNGLDLAHLPCLQTVSCRDAWFSLPQWLEEQDFTALEVSCSKSLDTIDLHKLACVRLRGSCAQTTGPWHLSDLLKIPRLAVFELWGDSVTEVVCLEGSSLAHRLFLQKTTVVSMVPIMLCSAAANDRTLCTPLRSNGHADICMCPVCVAAA